MENDWKRDIKLVRILKNDTELKDIYLEFEVKESENDSPKPGVLHLQKTAFVYEDVEQLIETQSCSFTVDFINDIYHRYFLDTAAHCNRIQATYIYPCTEAHIKKYSKKELVFVNETEKIYETVVQPYLEHNRFNMQWVYNIIDGQSEQERILIDSHDFLALPDIEWDGKDTQNLHILALVKSREIHSIRNLTAEHIPLLENILKTTLNFIANKYGVSPNKIRAFFHYPPTFYHLHAHFILLDNYRCGCEVERAHLVTDVIDNIRMKSDYYQTKTLYYKLPANDTLFTLINKSDEDMNHI